MIHTIKLKVQDSIFDEIMYFLKKLPQNEVEIIEEKEVSQYRRGLYSISFK